MNQQPCRTEAQNHMEQPKYKANNHPCYHFVLQDHNYGAPPPPTPPLSPTLIVSPQLRQNPLISAPLTAHDLSGMRALATVADHVRSGGDSLPSIVMKQDEDSRGSLISSGEEDNEQGLEGEETETAPEVDYDEDSVTRCICDFEHDDGYMICCDKCFVWQHVDCMGIDRDNIPEVYLCEKCQPRRVDRTRARNLQLRKKNHNDTSSSDDDNAQARKAAAANQVKKMNNNTGSKKRPVKKEMKKVVKRQKRDSAAVAAREQRANERRNNKKKESQNSNPVKTDSKKIAGRRRMSSKGKPESVVDEDTQDSWTSTVPLASQPQQVRNWIEQYEEAVTNHYSPELRARIQAIKVNGIHSDYRAGPVVLQKCRTTLGDAGVRVLLASAHLQPNQAIMEVRGKFMLVSQLVVKKSQLLSPYLLYYPLPKENTEVCVDARNFGNDARFARRSCKPNAELRHCIEKGALHLYLVAASSIEKNQEITIKHDDPVRIPCKHCPPLTPNPDSKKNGHIESHTEKGERRRRASRRNTEESVPEITPAPPVLQVNTPSPTTLTPAATPTPPAITPVVPSAPPTLVIQHPQTTPKKAPKSPVKQVPTPEKSQGEDSNDEDASINSPDKKKMTREERKMEAIMKAFERMEKQEQRKQAQQQHRRSERDSKDSDSSGRCRDEVENELDVVPPPKKKGRRTRGRSSSGASSQVLSADENSSGSHLVLSPGSASASASPRVVSSSPPLGFKFPKTKKVLMNEWLNKPEQPPLSPLKLEEGDGCIGGAAAAKKRWLRQAISEESEPPPSSSPRSASPDYLTPLKKRRLARESLEQHSCTPPATAASPELEADAALKQTPSLPLRCVEEAVMVLSGQMGIKLEPKEPSPPVLSPPPAIPAPSAQLATAPELPVALELPLPPPLPVSLAPPILPLSLLANPVPPPPPPLLLAAGPVDVNDIKEEAAPIPQPPPPAVAAPSPAAVKRKLSISEYRQRNKQKVEKTEPLGMDNNSPLGVDDDGKLIDGLDVKTEIPRWNSEPTSSEKQRENLTERLKREFGLFLDEQEKNEKDKVEEVLEQGPALPPLPPLEPPQPKVHDSLNIPLPSSPPPILDLLVMEPQPAPNLECPGSREEEDEFALRNGPSPLLIKSLTPAKMKASTKK